MSLPYNDYSGFIRKQFGERVQKISIDAGFTCPNRDGSKGTGGCIYCDNTSFNPAYTSSIKSITQQLNEGMAYFSAKYPAQKYIAYFQSFSNTYASVDAVQSKLEEALAVEGVIGASIATRPDCISDPMLEMIAGFAKNNFITIEYGVESTLNRTLKTINRCHTWEDSCHALKKTAEYGLPVCAHLILGLPGENYEDMLHHATEISKYPVTFLKLHQMQVLDGTKAAELFRSDPTLFHVDELDKYIDLVCDFVARLSPGIIIERFTGESPPEQVLFPKWNRIKNFEVTEKIRKRLIERGIRQGGST